MSRPCLAAVSALHWRNTGILRLTAHVCELLAAALEVVAVLGLDRVLDRRRHRVVGRQHGALNELDLTGHAALETASSSNCTAGLLTLSPGLGGASLAPLVWRGGAVGSAKLSGGLVAARSRVNVRSAMCLAWVLCRAVCNVCLCQAVGRVWAVLRVAVEGVLRGACRILVQERATDFLLVVPAGSVLRESLASSLKHQASSVSASASTSNARARGGHALRCYGSPHSSAGCTP